MDKRRALRLFAKAFLFFVPLILGFIGFADLYENPWSRLYHTMALFALNFDATEEYLLAHPLLQVARILAGAATFTVVISVAYHFWASFSAFIQVKLLNAVVVHGEGDQARRVTDGIRSSGSRVISCNCNLCYSAKNQILAFDTDEESLQYIEHHLQDLFPDETAHEFSKKIIMCSNTYSNSECEQEYFSIYNPAETCARLYWQDFWIDRDRFLAHSDRPMKKSVAIIGFDRLGEHLLNQALIMNVTDRQLELTEEDRQYAGRYWDQVQNMQGIDYYVIGSEGKEYCSMHPMLRHFLNVNGEDFGHKDSLSFFPSLAEMGIRKLDSMDLVIIAHDSPEECLEIMNRIVCAGLTGEIHVHCANEQILNTLYQTATAGLTIVPFGMNRMIYSSENLLHELMEAQAKEMHIHYAKRVPNDAADQRPEEPLREEAWKQLTFFQKLSNFASCDHLAVKEGLLKRYPFSEDTDTDTANLLMAIEHMRWERFYWLHNWEYSPHRNDAKHRHPSLVPFHRLCRNDQLKDYDMYRLMAEKRKRCAEFL